MAQSLSFLLPLIYFLVGDGQLFSLLIAPFVFLFCILFGISLRLNGSNRQFSLSTFVSLLFFITFVPPLILNQYFSSIRHFSGVLLILLSPFFIWSIMHYNDPFRWPIIKTKQFNGFAGYFTLLAFAVLAFPVFGPNNFYKIPTLGAFLLLNAFQKKEFWLCSRLTKVVSFVLYVCFFGFAVITGSRASLLLNVIAITVFVSFNLVGPLFKKLLKCRISTTLLLFLLSLPALACFIYIFLLNYAPRTLLLFTYLTDPDFVLRISAGTVVRLEWYSYLFQPFKLLNYIDLYGAPNPPWGDYPHNIFLDLLGNYGFFPLVILFVSLFLMLSRWGKEFQNNCPLMYYVFWVWFLSSLVSGTICDFYPVFSPISFYFVFKRKSNSLAKKQCC